MQAQDSSTTLTGEGVRPSTMPAGSVRPWPTALGFLAVLLVSAATFLTAARFDPEPYHDGAQVAPAIAVSHGLAIHRQAFDAYGPINAWLQGGALAAFGQTVLTARLISAVLLVVASLLLFALVRRVTGSPVIGTIAGIAWVVCWPGQAVSWGTPLLPWPSIPFLVAQLAAVLLIVRRIAGRRRPWEAMACGFLLALATCTRINYGVVLTVAAIGMLLLAPAPLRMRPREWAWGMLGGAAVLTIFVVALAASGSLQAFWDQAIFGALVEHGLSQRSPGVYWSSAFLLGSIPLLLCLLVPIIYPASWPRHRLVIVGWAVISVVGLTIWTTTAIVNSPLRDFILARLTWSPGLDTQAAQFQFFAADLTILLTLIAVVIGVIALLRRGRTLEGGSNRGDGTDPWRRPAALTFIALGATGLASLVQLYPIGDPNHLWWCVPLPLTFVVFSLTAVVSKVRRAAIVTILFLPYLLVSLLTTWTYYDMPRTAVTVGIFRGMYIPSELAPNVTKADEIFSSLAPHSTRFLCDQGAYAVWTGDYAAASARYVKWAFYTDSAEQEVTSPQTIVFCAPAGDVSVAEKYARENGYDIESVTPDVTLSYFANNDIVVLRRKSVS